MTVRSYSRRSFFKLSSLAAGALFFIPRPAPQSENFFTAYTEALGKQYRGTRDGRVLESVDGGRTWQQVAYFGSHCAVQTLSYARGRLRAQIKVAGYPFLLTSDNARVWRTVDGRSAKSIS